MLIVLSCLKKYSGIGADDAFIDYLNFLQENTEEFSFEIDIKDDKKI